MSASDAQTLIPPLPRQLVSTCDVPALGTLLTAWLHGTQQLSAQTAQTAHLHKQHSSQSSADIVWLRDSPSLRPPPTGRSQTCVAKRGLCEELACLTKASEPGVDFLWWTASLRPGPTQVPLRSGQRRKPMPDPPPLRGSPPSPAHGRRVLTVPHRPAPPPARPPPRRAPAPPDPDS